MAELRRIGERNSTIGGSLRSRSDRVGNAALSGVDSTPLGR
jgi:hypothetical protein